MATAPADKRIAEEWLAMIARSAAIDPADTDRLIEIGVRVVADAIAGYEPGEIAQRLRPLLDDPARAPITAMTLQYLQIGWHGELDQALEDVEQWLRNQAEQ